MLHDPPHRGEQFWDIVTMLKMGAGLAGTLFLKSATIAFAPIPAPVFNYIHGKTRPPVVIVLGRRPPSDQLMASLRSVFWIGKGGDKPLIDAKSKGFHCWKIAN